MKTFNSTCLVVALLALPLAAQETEQAPTATATEARPPERAAGPAALEMPGRQVVFRRLSPEARRRLDLQSVPTPPAYGISIGQYWDCRPVSSPFGPTGLETCRLTLVICDDEGNCVEL